MQAVKYSELWQIRGRGAQISDPLQIGFSSSEQILFDSENYSQGIYYGKVKSAAGVSLEVQNSGIVWLRFQLKQL